MKQSIGPVNALYPSLTVLFSTEVDGKPTANTIAHVGIMNWGRPQYISVSSAKRHWTNQGVHAKGAFGVNIPSARQLELVDYCGLASGKSVDKSALFTWFNGEFTKTPLIDDCPVCMECALYQVVDFPDHELFIGEVKATYVEEALLKEEKIDLPAVKPVLFDFSTVEYYGLGEPLGRCWNVGRNFKAKDK